MRSFFLCMITSFLFIACEKEENLSGKNNVPLPQVPKDTVKKYFHPNGCFWLMTAKMKMILSLIPNVYEYKAGRV